MLGGFYLCSKLLSYSVLLNPNIGWRRSKTQIYFVVIIRAIKCIPFRHTFTQAQVKYHQLIFLKVLFSLVTVVLLLNFHYILRQFSFLLEKSSTALQFQSSYNDYYANPSTSHGYPALELITDSLETQLLHLLFQIHWNLIITMNWRIMLQ